MTREKHIERHRELHEALDELIADWMAHSPRDATRLPSRHTIMELMEWSHEQTLNPTEPPL